MIEFEDVRRRFAAPPLPWRPRRQVEAVAGVTLSWGPGVRAVVGPNGAGKTTLLALLLGFLFPTAGRVAVGGLAPRRWLAANGAGYLPERFALPGAWPVRAALRGLARLEGLDRRAARHRAEEALDRFELGAHASRPVAELSRGLLQRVGLAQALLGGRRLVVLDEPTEGLDPLWRVRFRSLVRELGQDGRTVVIASHDLTEVERLADEVVLVDRGRVRETIALGPAAAEPRRYLLELAAPHPAVAEVFPGAEPAPDVPAGDGGVPGATPEPAGPAAAYRVEVGDAEELTRRLAAVIAAGATIRAVAPEPAPLERRIRRALEEGGAP